MTYEHKERRRQWVYEYGKFNNDYGRTTPKTPILSDIRQVDEIIKNIYSSTGEKIDTKIPETKINSYTRIHIYQENKVTEGEPPFDLFFVNTENSIPVIVFGLKPLEYPLDESTETAIVLSSLGIDPNNRDCEPCFKIYNYGYVPIIPLTSYNLEKAILDMIYGEDDTRNYLRDLRPLFKHNNIKKY